MENNIFEGVVWGQKFRTRNDREAVFYEHVVDSHGCDVFVCRVRGEINDSLHNADGTCSYSHELDIVSRYQEPSLQSKVDEEELNKFKDQCLNSYRWYEYDMRSFLEGIEIGYRKAMEDKA